MLEESIVSTLCFWNFSTSFINLCGLLHWYCGKKKTYTTSGLTLHRVSLNDPPGAWRGRALLALIHESQIPHSGRNLRWQIFSPAGARIQGLQVRKVEIIGKRKKKALSESPKGLPADNPPPVLSKLPLGKGCIAQPTWQFGISMSNCDGELVRRSWWTDYIRSLSSVFGHAVRRYSGTLRLKRDDEYQIQYQPVLCGLE